MQTECICGVCRPVNVDSYNRVFIYPLQLPAVGDAPSCQKRNAGFRSGVTVAQRAGSYLSGISCRCFVAQIHSTHASEGSEARTQMRRNTWESSSTDECREILSHTSGFAIRLPSAHIRCRNTVNVNWQTRRVMGRTQGRRFRISYGSQEWVTTFPYINWSSFRKWTCRHISRSPATNIDWLIDWRPLNGASTHEGYKCHGNNLSEKTQW